MTRPKVAQGIGIRGAGGRGLPPTKQRTLHMIGNAHIDAVWLWPWEEGFAEVTATFRSALDLMDQYPEFVFTCSSAAYYAWIEAHDPAMFEEIQRRVAEGRWQLVGGWWVEPDCNLPAGESYVRQALVGQRYFASRFGRIADVGYNPDSFGHNAMLPQILAKSGLRAYMFLRPQPHEKELPGHLFWWEAPDGSRVLAFRILHSYEVSGDLEAHVRRHVDEFPKSLAALACFYGVGNHGGGPTRNDLDTIGRLDADRELPRLRMSSPAAFFAEVATADASALPVVRDELQHHAVGCYAAVSSAKRWNRKAEQLLLAAERFSTIADREGLCPYPAQLSEAWKPLLFNQYHDILGGTSIEPAYEEAQIQVGETMAIADRALHSALQAISWRIDTRGPDGARPIVLFNPHAWPCRVPVEVELERLATAERLLDDAGHEVAHQAIRPQAATEGRQRIAFVAELPPLGYRCYLIEPTNVASPVSQPEALLRASDTFIQTDRWRLEIDPLTGTIGALSDRQAGHEVLAGRAARAEVAEDPSDAWSHGLTHYPRGGERFRAERVRLVENGPLRAVIRAECIRDVDGSRLVQEFVVYRDVDRIDVRVTVDWRGRFEILKLRFPVAVHRPRATWEIPYSFIERPIDGAEQPGQRWVDVTGATDSNGGSYGVSILNDGKYSSDVFGSEIGLTVLRSPIYAHHAPVMPDPDAGYRFTDQGIQSFTYAILPHPGDWRAAETVRRAAEFNAPPPVALEARHAGSLPRAAGFVAADPSNVIVEVVKRAEDGDDLIVRAYEAIGQAVTARIELLHWGRAIHIRFGPCEIKTIRIPRDADAAVEETDLLERTTAEQAS